MKNIITLLAAICCINGCIAQSQADMNEDAGKDYKAADKVLNETYNKILASYKRDTVFIKNFRAAQKAWLVFRDADLKAKYPDREPGYYGSVLPMCEAAYLTTLTEQRTASIKIWLDGIEEGDVCSGSVKTKD